MNIRNVSIHHKNVVFAADGCVEDDADVYDGMRKKGLLHSAAGADIIIIIMMMFC